MSAVEVARLREKLGLTQYELAEMIGVSSVAVHYWETGKRTPSRPATKLLEQLAEKSGKKSAKASKSP